MGFADEMKWAPGSTWSFPLRYGLALVSVAAALGISLAFIHFHLPQPFAAFALSAIALTFWYAGTKPGILAALLASIVRSYFFDPGISTESRILFDLVFLVFALLMTQVVRERNELERRVAERTADLTDSNDSLKREIAEHNQTEAELRLSQAYLAEAQRLSQTGSFGWNVSSGEIHWSEETYTIFELDRAVKPALELVFQRTHPDDRDLVKQKLECATETRSDFDLEHRLLMADGSLKYVHVLARALETSSGDLEFVGAVTDVSERKRAEEALRASENNLRRIVDSVPGLQCALSPAGRIEFANRPLLDYFGKTIEEMDRWSTNDVVHPDDIPHVIDEFSSSMANGTPLNRELRCRRADGVYRWFEASIFPVRDADGRITGWYCLITDIEDRKRAEYLTGQVFECSPDAVLIIGTDYRYKRVNPIHARNWGRQAESMVGMHMAELVGKEFFEQKLRPFLDRCFAGENVKFDDWFENARGHRFIAATYSPLRSDSQQVEAALVIARDLTEHVLASEALRQAQADLAHASRMTTMGELTASLAHEVNQPITAAVNGASTCVRWLTREDPDLEEAREAASGVIRNAKRAADIINHIRAISKKGESKRQMADVNELIREMVSLLRSETNRYSILVRTELDSDLPNVMVDPVLVQQVMMNLMMNGIDAMKEVDRAREFVICSARAENGCLMVSVSDKGVGLDPLQLDRIFDAFFTTKPQGIGMGLRISRSIVESHGGRLWAASNFPHGAIFYFILPAPTTAHLEGYDAEGAHTNV